MILYQKLVLQYFILVLEERRRREVEFRERHQVVQLRKQMLERLQQRDKIRQQLADNEEMLGMKLIFVWEELKCLSYPNSKSAEPSESNAYAESRGKEQS